MKKIPDRWLDYKAIGNVVEGSNFIAFKVPLHKHISERLPIDERHTTFDVAKAIPKLGIVINLTNTQNDTKYYSPRDWDQLGIEYKWIKTEGHVTPSQSNLVQFCRTVKNFLIGNPEKLIGVHCTHGLNRTGYFVCSYMVLCNNMSPTDAMRNFSVARGHQIERANYISSVMTHNSNQQLKQALSQRAPGSKPSSRNNSQPGSQPNRPNPQPVSRDNTRHRSGHNSQPDRRQIHTQPPSRWGNNSSRYANQQAENAGYERNGRSQYQVDNRQGTRQGNFNTNSRPDQRRPERSENRSRRGQFDGQRSSRWGDTIKNTSRWGERSVSASKDPGWSQWVNQRMGNERK